MGTIESLKNRLRAVENRPENQPETRIPAPIFLGPDDPYPTNGAYVIQVGSQAAAEKLNQDSCPVIPCPPGQVTVRVKSRETLDVLRRGGISGGAIDCPTGGHNV